MTVPTLYVKATIGSFWTAAVELNTAADWPNK